MEFKDAMTRLKEITGFDGAKLEKAYNELKGDFDGCTAQADAVRKRFRRLLVNDPDRNCVEFAGDSQNIGAYWTGLCNCCAP